MLAILNSVAVISRHIYENTHTHKTRKRATRSQEAEILRGGNRIHVTRRNNGGADRQEGEQAGRQEDNRRRVGYSDQQEQTMYTTMKYIKLYSHFKKARKKENISKHLEIKCTKEKA